MFSNQKLLRSILLLTIVFFGCLASVKAQAVSFTYQDSLKDGALPANGNFDFQFTVFNSLSGGNPTSTNFLFPNVPVTNGIFSVKIVSGTFPFLGGSGFLEIRVGPGGGGNASGGAFTLNSTIGQSIAGTQSTGGNFAVLAGFWSAEKNKTPFDFDGNRKTDVSIFRPAPGEWWYSKSSNGQTIALQFGSSTDKHVQGDYTGDGKFDSAVFRPANSTWFLHQTTSGVGIVTFGIAGDLPVPSAFVP